MNMEVDFKSLQVQMIKTDYRYVAALDNTDESRTYDSIYIHHAALFAAQHNSPDRGIKIAEGYMRAAVSE